MAYGCDVDSGASGAGGYGDRVAYAQHNSLVPIPRGLEKGGGVLDPFGLKD